MVFTAGRSSQTRCRTPETRATRLSSLERLASDPSSFCFHGKGHVPSISSRRQLWAFEVAAVLLAHD
jgi:hypothetical protein